MHERRAYRVIGCRARAQPFIKIRFGPLRRGYRAASAMPDTGSVPDSISSGAGGSEAGHRYVPATTALLHGLALASRRSTEPASCDRRLRSQFRHEQSDVCRNDSRGQTSAALARADPP